MQGRRDAGEARTDEVAILEVETIQLVAGGFGVHDILVDDERGALCVVGDALADLARGVSMAKSEDSGGGAWDKRHTARGQICQRGRRGPLG